MSHSRQENRVGPLSSTVNRRCSLPLSADTRCLSDLDRRASQQLASPSGAFRGASIRMTTGELQEEVDPAVRHQASHASGARAPCSEETASRALVGHAHWQAHAIPCRFCTPQCRGCCTCSATV